MTGATIAEGVAERTRSVAFGGLTTDALHGAMSAVLDTVRYTVTGAHERCARNIAQAATSGRSGSGPANQPADPMQSSAP